MGALRLLRLTSVLALGCWPIRCQTPYPLFSYQVTRAPVVWPLVRARDAVRMPFHSFVQARYPFSTVSLISPLTAGAVLPEGPCCAACSDTENIRSTHPSKQLPKQLPAHTLSREDARDRSPCWRMSIWHRWAIRALIPPTPVTQTTRGRAGTPEGGDFPLPMLYLKRSALTLSLLVQWVAHGPGFTHT